MTPVWTASLVQQRLREAAAVELRLPDTGRPRGLMQSAWPATPTYEFKDLVSWTDSRERVWKSWERAKGAHAFEITRMEESFSWLQWVDEGERRCLAAWAAATAGRIPVRKVLRKRGWVPGTFYRKVRAGSGRIAAILDQRGVAVR